jgi:hypothetical protein
MTEKEAKTKWCPCGMANINNIIHCVGSACMAWRATDNEVKGQYPYDPNPDIQPAGYCGLGGKP